jgi:acyl carrier protein
MASPLTRERVDELIASQLGIDPTIVRETSRLVEDLGCDSLDMVGLLVDLEEESGLDIIDADADQWLTVLDVYRGLGLA